MAFLVPRRRAADRLRQRGVGGGVSALAQRAGQGSGVFRNCPFCRACEQWAEIALLMGAGTPRDHVGL